MPNAFDVYAPTRWESGRGGRKTPATLKKCRAEGRRVPSREEINKQSGNIRRKSRHRGIPEVALRTLRRQQVQQVSHTWRTLWPLRRAFDAADAEGATNRNELIM